MANDPVVYGLWCLCHPADGIRYVGRTRQSPDERLRSHISAAKKRRLPIHRWIIRHQPGNIFYTILEICTSYDVGASEIRWISYLKSCNQADLNLTNGGDGGTAGYKWTDEQRASFSEISKLRGILRSTIDKANAASRGRKQSPEAKAKIGAASTGRIVSDETRQKMSQSSPKASAKLDESQVRTIKMHMASGQYSQAKLARMFHVDQSTISHIATGKSWATVHIDQEEYNA